MSAMGFPRNLGDPDASVVENGYGNPLNPEAAQGATRTLGGAKLVGSTTVSLERGKTEAIGEGR